METPKTRYALSGELNIAYQVVGDGPIDLVHLPGLVSHLDLAWEHRGYERFMRRLAGFARVIILDRRGMGLSDPVAEPPSIEERIDDARAVMDELGIGRAAVFGSSQGATIGTFFAASHPDRVSALVLYGSFARLTPDPPDYPCGWDDTKLAELTEVVLSEWGEGGTLRLVAPSKRSDTREREWWGRFERASISRGGLLRMMVAELALDIRQVLPLVQAPTLLMHKTRDVLPIEGARYIAERIPDAKLIELDGEDHWPWIEDPDEVCDYVEEFLTGARHAPEPSRVLATVLFTDIVGSTERAAEMGDQRWRALLERHESLTRRELGAFGGREVKTIGDGFLATFDGPTRAVRCARSIVESVRPLGIELRAGLHAGECELRNGDVGGIAVHIGARVASLAAGGEVLVSSTVRDLTVGSDLLFDDRGAHQLKGVPGEWRLFAVSSG